MLPAVVQRPEGPKEPSCQEMYWLEGLVCKPGQLGPEGRLTPITTLGPGYASHATQKPSSSCCSWSMCTSV